MQVSFIPISPNGAHKQRPPNLSMALQARPWWSRALRVRAECLDPALRLVRCHPASARSHVIALSRCSNPLRSAEAAIARAAPAG